MATPSIGEWITKEQAAEELHVSTRHIERLAAARNIPKRFEKPGGERRYGRTLYLRTAIVAIGEARVAPAEPNRSLAVVSGGHGRQAETWGALAAHLTRLSTLYPAPKPRLEPWLSLPKAAEYSGLDEETLVALIRGGQVRAIGKDGQDAGPGRVSQAWRVQRASLDAFGEVRA